MANEAAANNENMGEDLRQEINGLFEDMPEPTRAQILQDLADKYCVDCGSVLPDDPDEDCACQDDDEDDEGDDDEDGGDESDPDEDEDESEDDTD
jgi:hypothetical protein